jgi:DNA-binding MarR family transcriptional regulator
MSNSATLQHALRGWTHTFMRRMMSESVRYARDAGLSMQQFSALYILHHDTGRGVSHLADHLGVSSAAASQMIERLVQQGLLDRVEDPADRRVRQIVLSVQGRELIEKNVHARRGWIEALVRALSPEEQASIAAALDRLTEAALELDRQS